MKVKPPSMERFFSREEVAEMWGLDADTITRLFKGRRGVMHLGSERRCILRISETALDEVRQELIDAGKKWCLQC